MDQSSWFPSYWNGDTSSKSWLCRLGRSSAQETCICSTWSSFKVLLWMPKRRFLRPVATISGHYSPDSIQKMNDLRAEQRIEFRQQWCIVRSSFDLNNFVCGPFCLHQTKGFWSSVCFCLPSRKILWASSQASRNSLEVPVPLLDPSPPLIALRSASGNFVRGRRHHTFRPCMGTDN